MEQEKTPSNAQNPDLDWSQVRETVMMLNLAVSLIKAAMHDGDSSIDTLVDSFTTMSGNIQSIGAAIKEFPDTPEHHQAHSTIKDTCENVHQKMQSAIMAFQFYDKLSQRLSHISDSLLALSKLVSDQNKLYNPYEWKSLQEKIKSRYSIPEEVEMFNAILAGASIDEAVKLVEKSKHSDDDIELF